MVETITAAASPALDHIIERPRLIARLREGGGARVSVLAAPAGYGKTTLARQWSQRQAGPVAWYRTTRASGDVALLAVQLDELLASVAPELPREPGRVASIASINPSPQPLGRAIVRTFAPLDQDVLLVVDEWEMAETNEAEQLLSMLVEGLDIRFLITTRTRPEWFTPRLEVYGEGLEIGVSELAMTDDEATQVLAALGAVAGRARLMRTAGGWPAVLGLAAMSGDVDFTSSRLLSHTLYDFLASELLASAAEETQEALMLLAVASVSDIEIARSALGAGADSMLEDAVARGLLAVTERRSLSLHPLLRELLTRRFGEADTETQETLLSRGRTLLAGRHWDEALCVAEIARDSAFATEAIGAALDDLLASGRTSSLQRWVAAARAAGAEGGLIDYAESEALLRANELDRALAFAAQATLSLDGDLAARAHLVAGRSAHLTDRVIPAQMHADQAALCATSAETHEGSLWLRFIAGLASQAADLRERLDDFERSLRPDSKQSLHLATGMLTLAQMEGGFESALEHARVALSLADERVDAIAHTGLLSTYSYSLIIACRYEESLESLAALRRVAEASGMDFPLPYAQLNSASACIGLRRFAAADRSLAALEREMRDEPGGYFSGQLPILRARLYGSVGDVQRALDVLTLGPPPNVSRGLHGEFLGWQALFHAASGEFDVALELAGDAAKASRGFEVKSLSLVTRGLTAMSREGASRGMSLVSEAISTGAWDPILIAVRAVPDLGRLIAERRSTANWLRRILLQSSDTSLAALIGLQVPRSAKPKQKLTPRESEVHELLANGLTNEQIANSLYISLSTTKVHVKHIYEKLGVRSRLEAARALRGDV
ncbi:MAG TPA: LuxR C-terminal-related transcriptional regulator [Gaiellaceae bacterium]|nr:LuxR C-terminal-related transcriptional regulator [Gaiellaceae bacterium]